MRSRAAVAAAVMAALAGCGPAPQEPPLAGRYHGNGVTVTVRQETAPDGGPQLAAEFRPDEPGFHLYSIDLPAGGVDGLGVATAVTVQGRLRATGRPRASEPVRLLAVAGSSRPLPVYPDGAVTVTVPVTAADGGRAEVVVSYAACSESSCLPPVVAQPVSLAPA
jgi:hypothetical protein